MSEVIEAARRITGLDIPVQWQHRRTSDPAHLIADSREAREMLGRSPIRSDLDTTLTNAWRWEQIRGQDR